MDGGCILQPSQRNGFTGFLGNWSTESLYAFFSNTPLEREVLDSQVYKKSGCFLLVQPKEYGRTLEYTYNGPTISTSMMQKAKVHTEFLVKNYRGSDLPSAGVLCLMFH
jgi:hypothetical protein